MKPIIVTTGIALLIISLYSLTNCVPATIIAGATSASSSKRSKQMWTADLRKTNLEREKSGLKPLDWCEEAYKFKISWALKDKDCRYKLKKQGKIK